MKPVPLWLEVESALSLWLSGHPEDKLLLTDVQQLLGCGLFEIIFFNSSSLCQAEQQVLMGKNSVAPQQLQSYCSAPTLVFLPEPSLNHPITKSTESERRSKIWLKYATGVAFLANLSFLGCTWTFMHLLMVDEEPHYIGQKPLFRLISVGLLLKCWDRLGTVCAVYHVWCLGLETL